MDENIDEKLITWNSILDEIRIDTDLMIQNLLSGITYVAASGILLMVLGVYVLFIGLKYGNRSDPLFNVLLTIATMPVGVS